tara:strand:+ start:682 stop:1212 length:531 start_codon:yes stop_codon:yes gene_type:complete
MSKSLIPEDFYRVVEKTPLVSVDLIIKNKDNEIVLGYRNNNPAFSTYFTPGGVIRKNEKVDDAIKRVLKDEVGIEYDTIVNRITFNGVFNHFYDNNFTDDKFGTHYVCLSYIIDISNINIENTNNGSSYDNQHSSIGWYSINDLKNNTEVHQYVKEMTQRLITTDTVIRDMWVDGV